MDGGEVKGDERGRGRMDGRSESSCGGSEC